jgi:hypothetical protein
VPGKISGPREDENVLVIEVIAYVENPQIILITYYDSC